MIYAVPVDFDQQTNAPKDPHLYEAVQKYFEREFGEKAFISRNLKTWAIVSEGEQGEYIVHAAGSLRFQLDCPLFHVTAPMKAEDKEQSKAAHDHARSVRDMLMGRMASYLQDTFGTGTKVNVFVHPDATKMWNGYLQLIGAKPANRWEVQV